jgi:hypothetical protein
MFAASKTAAVASAANWIEDCFSCYLYTGTGATQTITNGIDLSTKGGLVWTKKRSAAYDHFLFDTLRGVNVALKTNTTAGNDSGSNMLTAFNSSGFDLGSSANVNQNAATYASWTFRKQAKFFDVVTYTGNGNTERSISHALGSAPGFIIIKNTSGASNWSVYHRSLSPNYLLLNSTARNAVANISPVDGATYSGWIRTADATTFSVTTEDPNTGLGTTGQNTNQNGATYVAYLFAHNAGGFGAAGTDNVISCGSFTSDASGNATVNLGYEPQWVIIKRTDTTSNWTLYDTMRGLTVDASAGLFPNTSGAEVPASSGGLLRVNSTGFATIAANFSPSATFIYIAIRRGPMKTPTSGTSVYSGISTSAATGTTQTTGFPIDLHIQRLRSGSSWYWMDRLRGVSTTTTEISTPQFQSNSTSAESNAALTRAFNNTGFQVPSWVSPNTDMTYSFQRAPGFFDEVCYTGTGSALTVNHNLGVAPELIIAKCRSNAFDWPVVYQGAGTNNTYYLNDFGNAWTTNDVLYNPTATQFTVGAGSGGVANTNTYTYVAYLFASVTGVSKVGSYTGTGATQTIDCGFSSGARFVLIKRTNANGDWYVWDTARGMVSGTDPSLLLNSTAAEVNANSVYTTSVGFQIVSTAAGINASGGTYIFLAIA